ncbi:hypothetical protein LguiA_035459 [Lonicera macranthoides]
MDLNFKGKAWVGNIRQKFEDIFQQVDGFVSQAVGGAENNLSTVVQDLVHPKADPVKHEEQTASQEQIDIVGTYAKSAENNLSTVVQDLVHPKVDPVKHEEQTASQEHIDIVGTYAMISTEEKAIDIDIKQSREEQEPNHHPEDADKDVDALIYKNTSMGVEGNVNLEISAEEISLTDELTCSLDLSYSEDKNLSEASLFSEPADANFPLKEEKICCDPAEAIGCVNESPSALVSVDSCSTLAHDKKDGDVGLAFSISALSLESNNADSARRTDEAVSLAGSSRDEHEQSWKCAQFEDFIMSPLEIGHVDGCVTDNEDGSMESIDLSDDENPDESCVVVDSRPVYAFTSRARRFRSCKKIIQDAFTSRKRLAKEYEQLEILYGDIDGELDENTTLPFIATMPSFKAKKSATEDSEWELV